MAGPVAKVAVAAGTRLPPLLYGTAWKEDATAGHVRDAIAAGFRGIDTANQRKHYHEAGVGDALRELFAAGTLRRDELFLQTKFTFRDGQDHRLPYDPDAPIATQVAQSFQRSLEHLATDRIDSLILHGPSAREGLGPADREAWRAMEALVDTGAVGLIGISNVTAHQVTELVAFARIPPAFVQNRCYAERGWDRAIRGVCDAHGLIYQAFSLLTANRQVLAHPGVTAIAAHHARTPAQIVFRFAAQLGMLPLTGTRDPAHMREDLALGDVALSASELAVIAGAGGRDGRSPI